MQIFKFQPHHIDRIIELTREFDEYLQGFSSVEREEFDVEEQGAKLMRYGFGEEKSFSWYVAEVDGLIVWYALYHYGFDPDEMQWKVIHLIDFFVSESARGYWVGRALIDKLQSHEDSIGLYFWVWKKNIWAIEFYKKIGAEWCDDVPFMKLMK